MKYGVFKDKCVNLAEKAGVSVKFDRKDGRFFANFDDGTTVVGNSTSHRVSVLWGDHHCAYAEI